MPSAVRPPLRTASHMCLAAGSEAFHSFSQAQHLVWNEESVIDPLRLRVTPSVDWPAGYRAADAIQETNFFPPS